jgi:hypothetical protein
MLLYDVKVQKVQSHPDRIIVHPDRIIAHQEKASSIKTKVRLCSELLAALMTL